MLHALPSEVKSHVGSFFARSSIAVSWERRRRVMERRVKTKEKEGSACSHDGRLFFQALLQVDSPYICFLHLSICCLVPLLLRGWKGQEERAAWICSFFRLFSELFPDLSVHLSQTSAGFGFQLDDPLPSMVTVVQVQKVRVRIQAVLTCRKYIENFTKSHSG